MSNPIASFDEETVKSELHELVGKTIEEAIDAMLDEEPTSSSAPTIKSSFLLNRYAIAAINLGPAC